jgi:hypothetical protein
MMAMCGNLGVEVTGCNAFGYGNDADKAYAAESCRTAFDDQTDADINARMKSMLQRACELMHPEGKTVTSVAKALRLCRRLTRAVVKDIMQESSL